MTEIVTWNIQSGRGVDGRVDLERIAGVIQTMTDADVICLQEVSRWMPELDNGAGTDQVESLSRLFPGHVPFFGPCFDRAGNGLGMRQSFGNLVLSRLPVLSVFRHHLPQPAADRILHMPRQAIEVTVSTAAGPLRIATTHLEFHSLNQRQAQIERLRALHAEAAALSRQPPRPTATGPYEPLVRPEAHVLCGDFNLEPDGPEYRALSSGFPDGTPVLVDTWRAMYGEQPHDPTCGLFDTEQWPGGKHCRDYFFVTAPVAERVKNIEVDTETAASDHQPLVLSLKD